MEEDLTWLVRETKGEWFGNSTHIARDGLEHYLWASKSVEEMVHRYPGYHWFTKAEYLASEAELQNKPSWSDAPEWANWLCQRDDGMWFWCIEEPRVSEDGWETSHEARAAHPSGDQVPENVLGDWRDTLERRPESKPEFEQFVSIEDGVPVKAQVDGGWFERGELPPVGIRCEAYIDQPPQWIEAEIVAHRDGFAIGWCNSVMKGCHGDKASEFRPIRTDRDELVEALSKAGIGSYALIAAGFKRDGGGA